MAYPYAGKKLPMVEGSWQIAARIARLARPPLSLRLALGIFLLLGLGIRLYDLSDPPLDFNPTRQLLGALVSRGMYYQMLPQAEPTSRQLALEFWDSIEDYEPPIFNRLVALTYLASGGEHVGVARVYAALFWLAGGVALYALASRMVSARSALVALGFYLFLPFAIYASRSFQVDPLMVMMILLAAYAFHRWAESRDWGWALAAGALAGLAILVKVTAGFPIFAMAAALVLGVQGVRRSLKDPQIWTIAALAAAPGVIYYLVNMSARSSSYFSFWTLSMWHLVLDPSFFVRWMSYVHHLVDLSLIFISLFGLLLAPRLGRSLLSGMWTGYLIYGIFFPFQIRTHDYYHLMLVPIMALSMAPLAEAGLARLAQQPAIWRLAFLGLAIAAIGYPLWVARSTLLARDFRHEPPIWREIGETIPRDGDVIALTHDYGYRLMYYGWRKASQLWPVGADLDLAALRGGSGIDASSFEERTQGKRYFLITLLSELESQAWLKDTLYSNYRLLDEGDGYLIFDLQQPAELTQGHAPPAPDN